MAQIELLQPTEKIKDSYGKINTSLTNLNNDKLEKSGDTMTGLLTALGGIDLEVPSVPTGKVGRMHANGATNQIYYHDGTDWRELWHSGNNPASLATNGYQIFANGAIVQHGRGAVSGNNEANAVTFPIVFPNDCDVVVGVLEGSAGEAVSIESITPSGFTARSAATSLTTLHYIAWGR